MTETLTVRVRWWFKPLAVFIALLVPRCAHSWLARNVGSRAFYVEQD